MRARALDAAHLARPVLRLVRMPTCIYNREPTTGNEPEEHPIPEALGGREALPRGAVCAECNAYVSDLDQALRTHTHIAWFLVLAGVPGKGGKVRRQLAWGPEGVAEYDIKTGDLLFAPKPGYVQATEHSIAITHPASVFNDWKFSRALHKIALGVRALRQGVEVALDPRFDEVRTYVRRPASRRVFRSRYHRFGEFAAPTATPCDAIAVIGTLEAFYICIGMDEFVVALAGDVSRLAISDLDALARTARGADDGKARTRWALEGPDTK